jgi:hypothetical protein
MANQRREVIYFNHEHFTLYISAEGLEKPRKQLSRTYEQRSNALLSTGLLPASVEVKVGNELAQLESGEKLSQPFFFENRQYWFEIDFKKEVDVNSASVSHNYRLLEQSFTQSHRGNALQAMINFGNDVGQCVFNIHYVVDNINYSIPVRFNVLATKMVQSEDLSLMNQAIDKVYPLWRYSISSKTEQSQGQSNKREEKFELFWLAQFERLFSELTQAIKRIIHAPHNRLQSYTVQQKLDRIHKKLSAKQQEHARELIHSKRLNERIRINQQRLNVDTPENRFIKMVLKATKANITSLLNVILAETESKTSNSFNEKLQNWREQINNFSKHQLWQEVGVYEGTSAESKVLQQKSGYSKVYSVWQQLKHYLNKTNGEAKLSIKSVADIYEIWCFLAVKEVIEKLGFKLQQKSLSQLKQVQFERKFAENSLAAAFVYQRDSDGMTIELAHEPSFTPRGQDNRTWLANQRPDIVLRVTLSNEESFLILFDAKYRIDAQQFSDKDGVPEDAINQMHRYRDAIIHQQKLAHEKPLKSRPVMGAFALYPGFFEQDKEENPYQEAIDEIGIGAFALLPSNDMHNSHSTWLYNYLERKLGVINSNVSYQTSVSNDYYFVEDAARISPFGVANVRHHGLTMIAPINEIGRDNDYLEQAKQGKLRGYHTQLLATNRQNVHRNIIREIRYLLLTVRENDADTLQKGKYLYHVDNVKLVPRNEIDVQYTGKPSNDNRHYWLFEFSGEPLQLKQPIEKPYQDHFEFKLSKAEHIQQINHWDQVSGDFQLYTELNEYW